MQKKNNRNLKRFFFLGGGLQITVIVKNTKYIYLE